MTGRPSSVASTRLRSELAPLADRLLVLGSARLATVLVVAVVMLVASDVTGPLDGGLRLAALTYAGVAAVAEVVRRMVSVRAIGLVNVMLLLDGVWVAYVLARTGGPDSVFSFLLPLHVVAVTLLLSYRSGLKVTAWHSLLAFVGYFAAAGELIDIPVDPDRATLHALALWLVAFGTAGFSAVSERELRRGKAELRAHAELATSLEETRDADEVASLLLAHAVAFFGFRRGAVVIRRPSGWEVRSREADVEVVVRHGDREHVDAVVARTWESRTPALVRTLDDADVVLAEALPWASNLVVVPMVAGGAPVGALVLEQGGSGHARIRGRVVSAVAKLASHAALALRNAALLDEVGRLAHVDSLTGLANRRVFEEALGREVARATRSGEPVSLVLFDVDYFKTVNDTLGHQEGDEVLRRVAAALAEACREADLPARYGGEEFAVLLPACSPGEGYRVAERLRAAVAAAEVSMPVTMSAGVAGLPAHASTPDELLRKADDALYAAKRAGRDRTMRARARSSRHAHVAPRRRRPARGHPRPAPPSPPRRAG
ncbi:MAG: sensor domain-containing diguanylate cyclase [Actinobacteria bacterium]|nr:sensor domain-containing diguanylate cyclase [Actinomycetota bacterium]